MGASEDQAATRLGQVLRQKWTLEGLLGVGGMAAVYAARHRNGARGALKILHPEMSQREDVRERFLREGYAANKVAHPGAVQVLDDDVAEDGSAFLVMELLEGESLTARVNRTGGAAIDDLLGWVDQALDVLAAAHAAGIVHRDLKPDNIFLCAGDRVKLLDFGIARVADAMPSNFRTRAGTALGTVPYMAPEQALGRLEEIDGRTDLFAIGATMFRVIARRKVHEAKTDADLLMAMATLAAPPLSSVAPHVPLPVCALVDRALAFLPSHRYPDAATMQVDLRAARAGLVPPYAAAQSAAGIDPGITTRLHPNREEPTVQERAPVSAPASSAAPFSSAAPRSVVGPPPSVVVGPPPSVIVGPPSLRGAPASFAHEPTLPAMPTGPGEVSAALAAFEARFEPQPPTSQPVPSLPRVAPLPTSVPPPSFAGPPASARMMPIPADAPISSPLTPPSGFRARVVAAVVGVLLLVGGVTVWRVWGTGSDGETVAAPSSSASVHASPAKPSPPAVVAPAVPSPSALASAAAAVIAPAAAFAPTLPATSPASKHHPKTRHRP